MTTHAKAATYVADSDFTLYVGDVREQLRNLPAESVHCVVPFIDDWDSEHSEDCECFACMEDYYASQPLSPSAEPKATG